MRRSVRGAVAALASMLGACGLVNGLQGAQGIPSGAGAALTAAKWHGPVSIDQGASPGSTAPSLAWGQGAAWVAWYTYDRSTNGATGWVTRRPRGGDFAVPQPIPTMDGFDGGIAYPKIAIGETGAAGIAASAWVLNEQSDVTASSIWAARFGADLAIPKSAMVRVDDGEVALLNVHQLVADEAGDALLAFTDNGVHTFVAGQTLGRPWTGGVQISATQTPNFLSLAAGGTGSKLASWSLPSTDGVANDDDATATPLDLSSSGALSLETSKAVGTGADEQGAVAMRGDEGMAIAGDSTGIRSYTFSDGFWSGPQTVPTGQPVYFLYPALALNAQGNAVLLWREALPGSTDAYAGLLYASYWNGTSWSARQLLSTQSPAPHPWWAAVDLNDRGEAVAAWADFEPTGTYTRIFARVLETDGGAPVWSDAVAVDQDSPDAGIADQPQNDRYVGVALDRAGGAAQVIWIQTDPDGLYQHTWANWIETN